MTRSNTKFSSFAMCLRASIKGASVGCTEGRAYTIVAQNKSMAIAQARELAYREGLVRPMLFTKLTETVL